jgi:4-amino-4-deoxy-L-arabinose transferase-like glycosyltransferase
MNDEAQSGVESAAPKGTLYWLGFIIACFLLRLVVVAVMPVTAPEAYYWEWSQDLAWGYFDHPPMIAYVIRLFTLIGGDSAFFVRLGAVTLSLLTTIVLYLLAKAMFGRGTALAVCGLFQILPFFVAVSVLSVPDAPLAFFWILTVYFVHRATIRGQAHFWYAAGLSLGLDLLSKYHAFLMLPCILVYLLCSPDLRKWLLRREPYLALLIAFLVFLPNLYWNLDHRASTFRFLLLERHGAIAFTPKTVLIFCGGFLLFLSPLFAVLTLRLLPRMVRTATSGRDNRFLLLLSTSLPLIGFFGMLSPIIHIGAHWTAVGYTTLCLAAIAVLSQGSAPPRLWQAFPLASFAMALLMVLAAQTIPMIAAHAPPVVRIGGRTYDLKLNRLQEELYGWEEFRARLAGMVERMPNPARTFILGHNYRFVSHIRYLLGANSVARTTGQGWQNEYSIWDDIARLEGWDALFVEKEARDRDPELLLELFEHVEPVEELAISINHVKVRSFFVIRCYGYKAKYLGSRARSPALANAVAGR